MSDNDFAQERSILSVLKHIEQRLTAIEQRLWKAEIKDAVYGPVKVNVEPSGLPLATPEVLAALGGKKGGDE